MPHRHYGLSLCLRQKNNLISGRQTARLQAVHCQQQPRPSVPQPAVAGNSRQDALIPDYAGRRRDVGAAARSKKGGKGKGIGPTATPTAPDAAQLLRALTQLASRTTIIVGSHQAHALMDSLEPLLPHQLPSVAADTLASGLWAMTRLQLQPSQHLVTAVAHHLLQPRQKATSSSPTCIDLKPSQLQCCDTRALGSLFYSLNYFLVRDAAFWAAAAAAGQEHVRLMKPAGISNLLQGLAASGWSTGPSNAAASQGQGAHTSSRSSTTHAPGHNHQDEQHPQQQQQQQQQRAVTLLLFEVEQLLLSEPQRLGTWRLRDISQLCQSYALMGWNCTLLFATIANHLLEYTPLPKPPSAAGQPGTASSNSSSAVNTSSPPGTSWLQQQQQQWSSTSPVLQRPSGQSVGSSGQSVLQGLHRPWHYKGRGPGRLSECRAGDAVGLAWAFVVTWCTNRLLLQELATVLAAKAGHLHAADCARLLWAYATADVVDQQMMAAVTAAVTEEMSTVLPRTAASCVWSLGLMGFEAPGFMEAALDRLAACLEARPVRTAAGDAAVAAQPQASSGVVMGLHGEGSGRSSGRSINSSGSSTGGPSMAAAGPSVLQQLYDDPPAALLSGGPEVSHNTTGELSMLSMMHRRRSRQAAGQQQQQRQQQDEYPQQQGEAGVNKYGLAHILQRGEVDADQLSTGVPSTALSGTSSEIDGQLQQQQGDDTWDHQQQQQQQVLQGSYHPLQEQHQSWHQVRSQADLVHCSPQDVAQAMYACGRLQHYNAAFCSVLRVKFRGLLPGFSDSELVEALWGLARLNLYDADNMEAVAAELKPRVSRFPGALLGLTAWSYSSLRHAQPDLFTMMARRACHLAEQRQLKPLDASQLVRAAAKLCFRNDEMFKASAAVLSESFPRLGDSLVISSLWGFAVAGVFNGGLFEAGFRKISSLPTHKARPLLLLQLFQTATLLKDAYSTAGLSAPAALPSALMLAATRQWMFSNRRSPRSSRSSFQLAVVQVLEAGLGLRVEQELLTDDGLFSIDAAITWRGRRVAVEVDGPDHFTNSKPHLLLGNSVVKQRCLQARGWAVLSVPFYTWNALTKSTSRALRMDKKPQQQQQQQHEEELLTGQQSASCSTSTSRAPVDINKVTSSAGLGGAVGLFDTLLQARAELLATELDRALAVADLPTSLQ